MKRYTVEVNEKGNPVIENQTIQGGILVNQSGTIVRNCIFVAPYPEGYAIKLSPTVTNCQIENNTVLR